MIIIHDNHRFTEIGQIFIVNIFLIKLIFQFLGIRHAMRFPAGKSLVAVRLAHYNMEIHPDEIIRRFARLSVCMTPNPGKGALGS